MKLIRRKDRPVRRSFLVTEDRLFWQSSNFQLMLLLMRPEMYISPTQVTTAFVWSLLVL